MSYGRIGQEPLDQGGRSLHGPYLARDASGEQGLGVIEASYPESDMGHTGLGEILVREYDFQNFQNGVLLLRYNLELHRALAFARGLAGGPSGRYALLAFPIRKVDRLAFERVPAIL